MITSNGESMKLQRPWDFLQRKKSENKIKLYCFCQQERKIFLKIEMTAKFI
jgi:hypothetical protein